MAQGWTWYDRSDRIDLVEHADVAIVVLHHGFGGPDYESIAWSTLTITGGDPWSFWGTLNYVRNNPGDGADQFYRIVFPHLSRTQNVVFMDGHVETRAADEDLWRRPLYWRGH